jgi:virulence-associated protein VapD
MTLQELKSTKNINKRKKMYAIIFDIDANYLSNQHDNISPIDARTEIRKFMEVHHFTWQQGGVYFGNEAIDAVKCIVVVQKLSKKYPWFLVCVKDVRMLRIEENNDLMVAIE